MTVSASPCCRWQWLTTKLVKLTVDSAKNVPSVGPALVSFAQAAGSRAFCVDKDRMDKLVKNGVLTKEEAKKTTIVMPTHNAATKETEQTMCLRSCCQIAHERQWEQHWKEKNDDQFGCGAQDDSDDLASLRGFGARLSD